MQAQPPAIPAFTEIGKAAKDLLYGTKTEGTFQLNPKIGYTTVFPSGITLGFQATKTSDDTLDSNLIAGLVSKAYAFNGVFSPDGKVAFLGSVKNVAPGLQLSGSLMFPDFVNPKLGIDYTHPAFNVRSSITLKSTPVVAVAAATGYSNVLFGADVEYDSQSGKVSRWTIGTGYHDSDNRFQVGAFLAESGDTARLLYAHNISDSDVASVELIKPLHGLKGDNKGAVSSLGYGRRLPGGGLAKIKVDNEGTVSALYESKLLEGGKIALTGQMDARDLKRPPKLGFYLEAA